MKVTLCASMYFYKHCLDLALVLEKNGITAIIPDACYSMEKDNDFNVDHFIQKYYKSNLISGKKLAIKNHFNKIAQGDAILIVNDTKHGIEGYIGPNVLMEMGLAFHLSKPIYILYNIPTSSPFIEEILSMEPKILDGDVSKIHVQ